MRTREKLTLEEKFSLALALIKREQTLDEIRLQYRISHTTAYKIRNAFLEGGRAALSGERKVLLAQDLEARVSALEAQFGDKDGGGRDGHPVERNGRGRRGQSLSRRTAERHKAPAELLRTDDGVQPRQVVK